MQRIRIQIHRRSQATFRPPKRAPNVLILAGRCWICRVQSVGGPLSHASSGAPPPGGRGIEVTSVSHDALMCADEGGFVDRPTITRVGMGWHHGSGPFRAGHRFHSARQRAPNLPMTLCSWNGYAGPRIRAKSAMQVGLGDQGPLGVQFRHGPQGGVRHSMGFIGGEPTSYCAIRLYRDTVPWSPIEIRRGLTTSTGGND